MANQTVFVVNPTATAFTDVNAAGDDVPAYSMGTGGLGTTIVMTDAEQATFAAAHPKALIIGSTASQEERRIASKILRLGKNPGA